MRVFTVAGLAITALIASYSLSLAQQAMTPAQFHKEVGPCACPADKDKAGKTCGKRSAFCQSGGTKVKGCFLVDVERRTKAACG